LPPAVRPSGDTLLFLQHPHSPFHRFFVPLLFMKLPVNLEGVSSLSRSLQRVDGGLLEQPVESFSAAAGRLFPPFVDFLTMLLVCIGRWIFGEDPPIASNSVFLGGRGVFMTFS
jgi:hypothetical protein